MQKYLLTLEALNITSETFCTFKSKVKHLNCAILVVYLINNKRIVEKVIQNQHFLCTSKYYRVIIVYLIKGTSLSNPTLSTESNT